MRGDDGKPVQGRNVQVESVNNNARYYEGNTPADGSYRVTDLPSGAYLVNEGGDRAVTVQVTAGRTTTVEWHRATGISIHGTVTLSGGPGAGLPVRIGKIDGSEMYSTNTDQQGRYTVSPATPGEYLLNIVQWSDKPDAFFSFQHAFSVHPGDNQCDVDRLCTVSGQLLDAQSGKPLAAVPLQAFIKSTWHDLINLHSQLEQHTLPSWFPQSGATTDAQGRFTINNLPPGDYLITRTNQQRQFGVVLAPPFTLREREHKTELSACLPRTGAAEVAVVDAVTGAPIPGVPVVCVDALGCIISPEDAPTNPSAPSHTFRALPEGTYRIYPDREEGFAAFTKEYLATPATVTITAGNTTQVRLPLTHGGRLRLILQQRDGSNKTGHRVFIYQLSQPNSPTPVLSDAQGPYTGGLLLCDAKETTLALPAGTYRLQLRLAPVNGHMLSALTPFLDIHPLIDQTITISPGKDTLVTAAE